jgi:deoxycytidylate deaminase
MDIGPAGVTGSLPASAPLGDSHAGHLAEANRPVELVFGLVGPTGVDQDAVCAALQTELRNVGYETHEISLSKIIGRYDNETVPADDEFRRTQFLMDKGDDLRARKEQAEVIGLLGILKIRSIRQTISGDPNTPDRKRRVAYVVRSFKRPEEVQVYRDVYGKQFTLISIFATREHRIANLKRKFQGRPSSGSDPQSPEELAVHLMFRDNKEEGKTWGQRVGDTFPLADYFVGGDNRGKLTQQIGRLVRLTFGDPYISPTIDEQTMFFAQAAAYRSLDLSRQVGAAIVDVAGNVLATGCNEVPKPGGGLYWPEEGDCHRDFERGGDSNNDVKRELLVDALKRLSDSGLLNEAAESGSIEALAHSLVFGVNPILEDSKLFDVIEFGRSVHAEMAAISHAARVGVPLQNARLFCTTFPCHICARHIVAAGVREVVFIEPYDKSRVTELYPDSIVVEPVDVGTRRVLFRAFAGAAPRRYMDYFSPLIKRKSKEGRIRHSSEYAQRPRIQRLTFVYPTAELAVTSRTERFPPPMRHSSIQESGAADE